MSTWTDDPKAESLMEELGIKFGPIKQRHQLSLIKVSMGLRNQARPDAPLHGPTVDDYARLLDNGGSLEAVVVTTTGDVLAGNHRIAAVLKRGHTTIGAYVVDPPKHRGQRALDSFKYRDNYRHGRPLNAQERMEQCIEFYVKYGDSKSDLARDFNLKYDLVTKALRADEARRTLRSKKVNVDWSLDTYDTISGLKNNTDVMVAIAKLSRDKNLSQVDSCKLIREAKKARTSKGMMKVVDRWTADFQDDETPTKTRSRRAGRRTKLQQHRERLCKELTKPLGFKAFILHGSTGNSTFKTFRELGIEDNEEAKKLSKAIDELVQALNVIKGIKGR